MGDSKDAAPPVQPTAPTERHRRAGELVPGSMRRIGLRHAIVVEPTRAKVVDLGRLEFDLQQTNEQLERLRLALAQLEQQRTALESRIAQFKTAAVERIDGDPEVQLEEPVDPIVARAAAAAAAPEAEAIPPTEPSGKKTSKAK